MIVVYELRCDLREAVYFLLLTRDRLIKVLL